MGPFKLILAPLRRIVHFPLFQLAVTVAVILWLEAANDASISGQIYSAIDHVVDFTVQRCAALFDIKSFTRSWLTAGFWIAYVYLIGLVILYLLRLLVANAVELAARYNMFYLRNAIARERGIDAYNAWLPLESIRPVHIPQDTWEETFAWPPDNKPPYPPLAYRIIRVTVSYVVVISIIVILLQKFTPFPVLTWIGNALHGI